MVLYYERRIVPADLGEHISKSYKVLTYQKPCGEAAEYFLHWVEPWRELICENLSFSSISSELSRIISLALENCYDRAYDSKKNKPVDINSYHANQYLIEIIDYGKGIVDLDELINATIEGRRKKGTHFQYAGCGFDAFHSAKNHECWFDTSSNGTKISIYCPTIDRSRFSD